VQRFIKVWRQAPGPGAVEVDSAADQLRKERAERSALRANGEARWWRDWREARELHFQHRRGLDADGRPSSWPRSRWREGPRAGREPRGPWGRRDRTRP
jgi:hypothetical protein